MLLDELAFAVSAGAAQIATSLDNFAILLALLLTAGKGRAVAGYLLSQFIMLGAAMAAALGADQAMPGGMSGYLGVVPLALGLRGAVRMLVRKPGNANPRMSSNAGVLGLAALFLALSFDSFAVMAPLLADSQTGYRLWALGGAAAAVAGLAALAVKAAEAAGPAGIWSARLERIGPFVMIAAGIYVLVNSGTDLQ
ncbi:hypothetical protein [Leisingera sp. ANG59]|uniref:hypothetical protein n=1 Tax=Leisingera sp. ANG59 TaxID=2675221 RepID=UPI00157293A9|nr:hypothetical protein [Leisingera sp. ANG59]NSY38222.1 hypothetical protein [Leisingera sp. ANG59]